MNYYKTLKAVGISLILTATFFGLILLVAERPNARLSGQYDYIYDKIYNQTGKVDIAASGGSRVARAIYGPYLKKSFDKTFSKSNSVALDLAFTGDGIDAQVSVLRMLVNQRDVDYLIIQLYDNGSRKTNLTHNSFYKIGSLRDILFAPYNQNQEGSRLSNRTREIYYRLSETLDRCVFPLTECFKKPKQEQASSSDHLLPRSLNPQRARWLLNREKIAGTKFYQGERNWTIDTILNDRTRYFYEKLIADAKAHGTEVIVMDIPRGGMTAVEAKLAREIENNIGVKYIYPSNKELAVHYFEYYGDSGHVNLLGERFYRKKIIDYVKTQSAK